MMGALKNHRDERVSVSVEGARQRFLLFGAIQKTDRIQKNIESHLFLIVVNIYIISKDFLLTSLHYN
ncbi:hypothetical protein BHL54_21110 [Bacillus cereus]|nr:hypothetical protein BHL54_21110 [Bacillus cereus]